MERNEITYLVNCITSELIPLIMDDLNCDRNAALDKLYHTRTYAHLLDPRTGLYYQSTLYVHEKLVDELMNKQKGIA